MRMRAILRARGHSRGKNIEAFADGNAPIVTNAGGCGAMLAGYAHLLEHDESILSESRAIQAAAAGVPRYMGGGQQLHTIRISQW